jgi:hypothetical protein
VLLGTSRRHATDLLFAAPARARPFPEPSEPLSAAELDLLTENLLDRLEEPLVWLACGRGLERR